MMLRILDRYLLRSFLINYLLSLFVLISLYVTLDLFANIDEFSEGGKPVATVLRNIADYYMYNLPLYFSQLSGVIALFAACGTFARLHRQNEITAVLASGTSLYRLAAPIIAAGMGVNLLLVLDHELLLPAVAAKLARQRDDVEGLRTYEVWFVRDGEGHLLSAQRLQPRKQEIQGLIVMSLPTEAPSRRQAAEVITADRARWNEQQGGWDLLERGMRTSESSDPGDGLGGTQAAERSPMQFYPSSLSPQDLLFRKMLQWIKFLSVRQLAFLERRGVADPAQVAQVRHSRFTLPINNMILMILGLVFFLSRLPSSVLTQGTKAVAVCSVAFLVTFAGQQAVGSLAVPPALPAWLPVFIFGPMAVVLLDGVKT